MNFKKKSSTYMYIQGKKKIVIHVHVCTWKKKNSFTYMCIHPPKEPYESAQEP